MFEQIEAKEKKKERVLLWSSGCAGVSIPAGERDGERESGGYGG